MRADARGVAVRIVTKTGDTSRACYYAGLADPRDRAFSYRLAAGTLKWRSLLDHVLASFSSRDIGTLRPDVLSALRVGAFQLIFAGVPRYAAVDSVVRLLRRPKERSFVNGVLRGLSRCLGHVELPAMEDDPASYLAVRYSHPKWISDLIIRRLGTEEALRLADRDNRPAPLSLRLDLGRVRRREYMDLLAKSGYAAREGATAGFVQVSGADVTSLPGFGEGHFVVQDEGAAAVSAAVNPKEGDRVWDACAAPGGKTAHIAEMLGGTGEVVATDIDGDRVSMVRETADRLGLRNVVVGEMDATRPPEPGRWGPFDRILLDAPCSGLGVLRRHPDLRWNRRESDIPRMALRQAALLRSVARYVRPGGVLVYSTCTLAEEENEGVWTRFLAETPSFAPLDPAPRCGEFAKLFSKDAGAGEGYRYILPREHDTDCFFVGCALRKD